MLSQTRLLSLIISVSGKVNPEICHGQGVRFSSLNLANFCFGVARQALGHFLESSCLETAQALLLMVCSLAAST